MNGPRYSVERELEFWFSGAGRVVIAGIGNPVRMDDFVGVRIVQGLRGRVSEKVSLIECETVPENYVEQIIDFGASHVLLIDAALLGLKSGEARLVMPERITDFPAVSTHMLPLRIFCEYVAETTNAKIALLLIEPGRTDFGEGLTSEVETSARHITGVLLKVLP